MLIERKAIVLGHMGNSFDRSSIRKKVIYILNILTYAFFLFGSVCAQMNENHICKTINHSETDGIIVRVYL